MKHAEPRVKLLCMAVVLLAILSWPVVPSSIGASPDATVPVRTDFSQLVTTFNVSFQESGLPAGLTWSILLNGVNQSALSGTDINFTELAGDYVAVIGAPPGYSAGRTEMYVNGTAGETMTVGLGFASTAPGPTTYPVTFNESGLPTGSPAVNWSVTLNGSVMSSGPFLTLPSIGFNEPNGSYAYQVRAPGFNATPSSGTITVAGRAVSIYIVFTVNGSTGAGCSTNCSGGNGTPPLGALPPPGTPPNGPASAVSRLGLPIIEVSVGALVLVAALCTVMFYRARGPRVGSPSRIYEGFAVPRSGSNAGALPEKGPPTGVLTDGTDFEPAESDPLDDLLR